MKKRSICPILLTCTLLSLLLSARAGAASTPTALQASNPSPTPIGKKTPHVATPDELLVAQIEWRRTRHANTYDDGLGANTTCALCKAPRNYSANPIALQAAEDCAACKREPGQPRPDLEAGVPVAQPDWKSISCDTCHQPVGDSYSTAISYWDPVLEQYQPLANSTELCAKCHAEQHGFGVIREQSVSAAHKGWECSRCHGAHNLPVKCTDCHDVQKGAGASAHMAHSKVGCPACHDAGGLAIWQDPNASSRYYAQWMPRQMAHDLRSWPSHNLQTRVDCLRCHHPQDDQGTIIASDVRCVNALCHPDGVELCPWRQLCVTGGCHSSAAPTPRPTR